MKTETVTVDPRRLQRLTLPSSHTQQRRSKRSLTCSDRLGRNLLIGVIASVSAAHSTRDITQTTNAAKRSSTRPQLIAERSPGSLNDRFLRACKLLPVDTTPVWFMRQAGRYLPQYRKIREKHDIVTIYKTPELCSEVTVQPVEALGVDAAIMFADIVLPLEGMGVRFQIKEGVGPVIEKPIRMLGGAQVLEDFDTKTDAPFMLEAIELTKRRLDDRVPLIGFCGGPFTLASYLIEGGPARDFIYTKKLMYNDSRTWELLMDKLATAMTNYLQAQIQAGVDAIQLFDSWIGFLSPQDYRRYVLSYSQRIFKNLEGLGVPRIHFASGCFKPSRRNEASRRRRLQRGLDDPYRCRLAKVRA